MERTDFDHARFRREIVRFSAWLRGAYGLEAKGGCLANDIVRVRFSPGCVRDPWVHCSVSYVDDTLFRDRARQKSFYLDHYIKWKGFDLEQVFPHDPSIVGAPMDADIAKLTSYLHFLTWFGKPVLTPDREEMTAFAGHIHDATLRYNRRATGERSVEEE